MVTSSRTQTWRIVAAIAIFSTTLGLALAAQTKRPLTHKDYDQWRSISSITLSPDGKFLAYAWMPYDGDGDLVVREIATGKEFRQPVGALPPPPVINFAELEPDAEPPTPRIRIAFASDSRWVVSSTYPAKAETDQANRDKKKPEEMPKQGLLMMDLGNGTATRVERVKEFQVPEVGGPWVAYLKEPLPDQTAADGPKPGQDTDGGADADQTPQRDVASRGTRKDYGTDLVLQDLPRGSDGARTFSSALSFTLTKDASSLVYAVSSRSEDDNGVYRVVPGSDEAPLALLAGKGRYQKLTWDHAQHLLAFLSDRDDAGSKQPVSKAYLWDGSSPQATAVVSQSTPGFPQGMVVSDKGRLSFSRDGQRFFVPAGPPPAPENEDTDSTPADERVKMDLWHWQDDFVQPMQKVQANRERNRTYTGVWHIAERKYVQLADTAVDSVTTTDNGLAALGTDTRPYRRMVDYDGTYADLYVIDTRTGQRRLALKQLRSGFRGGAAWSPDGQFAAFYRDGHWHLLDAASLATRNLTETLPVKFYDEEDDTPDPPTPYGPSVWTKDGRSVLLYDRYDVWQLFADGSPALNLTGGRGREDKIVYRIQRVSQPGEQEEEEDARYADPSKPLYLRGESEETRSAGFFRTDYRGRSAPERLLWSEVDYQVRGQARDADVLVVTASRFDRFPDLHVTDRNFGAPKQVSDGDAQRNAYSWGTAELIGFRNVDGVPLKAVLYKPENFDPKHKYPMLIYIYEQLSQNLHDFVNPTPGTSINISYYVSNGYLVLTPDIVYTVGYPGRSALKCVLPAIDTVVSMGFVDENAIGIQGHSWGGYQIAYMVTQTTRFRAAEAGAPVGNMTSAYSGIRWGSGMPRQFQYEQTQSRIGERLMDDPFRFLDNSPVFYVSEVKTPLLILHNDADDAVPWYQGIELFLALRRNDKEAYLFNYNGELHGLRRRHNQRDWTVRMQQFFDYHLKGVPKPEWMEKGIRYIDRDEEKVRFRK